MRSTYYAALLTILVFILGPGSLVAQDTTGWTSSAVGNLQFTQTEFDNWSAGGEDSWSWQGAVQGKFTNEQPQFRWVTNGKLTYGKSKVGDASARKSTDEIRLESVITYKAGLPVDPYASASFLTQMTRGYRYPDTGRVAVADFLDPLYMIQSVGMGYKPAKQFQTRLGAAVKETITDEFPVPYADDPDTPEIETTRVEYGVESVSDLSVNLSKLIVFESRLALFSDLSAFDEIDVDWDNMFSAKVSDLINVSLNVKLFYDKDISPKRQLKQTLAVGIQYTLL